MGRKKPVILSSIKFESKKDATAFFREMLSRYRPGDLVSEADSSHLVDILKYHSDYVNKLGVGIEYFEVMSADYGSHCFGFARIDGTVDNFSFHHCIDNA